MVYDSLYDSIIDRTQMIIHKLFGVSKHEVCKLQGVRGCRFFAIAFPTAICLGQDLNKPFHLHLCLMQCFERGVCLPFPLEHGTSNI